MYDDFFLYKEGVYQLTVGANFFDNQAVELIGWGSSDDGTEYWIAKNSWNTDWGDQGYFKIKMGEVGIDDYVWAGLAREE